MRHVPGWAFYWRVDEVIECLPFGKHDDEVTKALMRANPDAYEPDRRGTGLYSRMDPIEENDPQNLAAIWNKLEDRIQKFIVEAYKKEWGWRDKA